IPLCDRAVAILKGLPRMADNDHVFPGGRTAQSIGPNQLAHAMKRLRPDLSPHSSRSAFKSWANVRTTFQPDVVEEAMLHKIGDDTERAYSGLEMLDKRRHLMDAWAAFCERPPAATAEVIQLRSK